MPLTRKRARESEEDNEAHKKRKWGPPRRGAGHARRHDNKPRQKEPDIEALRRLTHEQLTLERDTMRKKLDIIQDLMDRAAEKRGEEPSKTAKASGDKNVKAKSKEKLEPKTTNGQTPKAEDVPVSKTKDDTRANPLTRPSASMLANNGLSIAQYEWLESTSQKQLPRFLFRGFHSRSGGGDARLNTTSGITPHGFLKGKEPTTIYDIKNLRDMIVGHLGGARVPSEFSSWAACPTVSMGYAKNTPSSYLAIIDTTLVKSHVKAYHVPTLTKVYLASGHYSHEYLVYGPIDGPAYHCVPAQSLYNVGYNSLAGHSYGVSVFDKSVYSDAAKRVATAKALAALFRPKQDKRPDIIIALTAIFASLHYVGKPHNAGKRDESILKEMEKQLRYERDYFLTEKLKNSNDRRLVNPDMYTEDYPQIDQMVQLVNFFDQVRSGKASSSS
ncbi:hypothetical protein F4778DRAFT_797806 [Xylariomycetidae sp. FL2044]|nr:hypothetical protein F4778DRAFT_797806 [Xylariomycetidae sp. FL2044]